MTAVLTAWIDFIFSFSVNRFPFERYGHVAADWINTMINPTNLEFHLIHIFSFLSWALMDSDLFRTSFFLTNWSPDCIHHFIQKPTESISPHSVTIRRHLDYHISLVNSLAYKVLRQDDQHRFSVSLHSPLLIVELLHRGYNSTWTLASLILMQLEKFVTGRIYVQNIGLLEEMWTTENGMK